MFSMCSELTPRAHIPDTTIPQLMQPCTWEGWQSFLFLFHRYTLEGSFGRAFPHYLVAAGLDKEKFRCLLLKPLFVSRFCGKVLIGLDKQGGAGGGVLEGDSGFC